MKCLIKINTKAAYSSYISKDWEERDVELDIFGFLRITPGVFDRKYTLISWEEIDFQNQKDYDIIIKNAEIKDIIQ